MKRSTIAFTLFALIPLLNSYGTTLAVANDAAEWRITAPATQAQDHHEWFVAKSSLPEWKIDDGVGATAHTQSHVNTAMLAVVADAARGVREISTAMQIAKAGKHKASRADCKKADCKCGPDGCKCEPCDGECGGENLKPVPAETPETIKSIRYETSARIAQAVLITHEMVFGGAGFPAWSKDRGGFYPTVGSYLVLFTDGKLAVLDRDEYARHWELAKAKQEARETAAKRESAANEPIVRFEDFDTWMRNNAAAAAAGSNGSCSSCSRRGR